MNPIQDSLSFLIETVFQLAMLLVLLRFLFGFARVNFRNPLVEAIVNLSNVPINWLKRFVPGLYGVDLSAVVLFLGLALTKLLLLSVFSIGKFSLLGGLVWAVAKFLDMAIWVFIIAILMQAVMSWFMRQPGHPVYSLLNDLTQPIMRPIRNILPSMSGIDFSPIVAFMLLKITHKLLVLPIYYAAVQLM